MASVSVIIPSFNMGRYIGDAVVSVFAGSFADVEVIVVDDGSQDDTEAVMQTVIRELADDKSDRVKYFKRTNSGKAAAVNFGFDNSSGQYVTILDADDELTPESLSERWRVINASPNGRPDIVLGGFEVFDGDEVLGKRPAPRISSPSALRRRFYLGYKTPFHLNACLIKRELVAAVGGLDERLRRCEDGDLAIRLMAVCKDLRVVDSVVYRYRKHRNDASTRLIYRIKTGSEKPLVVWKNFGVGYRLYAIPWIVFSEAGKIAYESVRNYSN